MITTPRRLTDVDRVYARAIGLATRAAGSAGVSALVRSAGSDAHLLGRVVDRLRALVSAQPEAEILGHALDLAIEAWRLTLKSSARRS